MAWLKESDTAANHPIVLNALEVEDADDRLLNECFGFVNRCATQAAAYEQDYIVTIGTAKQMAGSLARYQVLVEVAKYCGYWTEVMVNVEGVQRKAFKLVEDNDLFHMILKAEREWNNQRKRDARNPKMTVPARHRDGDACRYCGKSVSWNDRVSGRAGSYDHAVPGTRATIDTYVVCCKECNGRRADDPDSIWKTLAPPLEPLYGPETVAFLSKYDITVKPTYTRTPTTPAPANGTQAAEESPAVEHAQGAAPAMNQATAPSGLSSDSAPVPGQQSETNPAAATAPAHRPRSGPDPDPARRSPESGFVGTGRDGTGQAGKGRNRQGGQPPSQGGRPVKQSTPGTPANTSPTRRRRPRKRKAAPDA